MEKLTTVVFWISIGIVAYTYVGYGVIIYVFSLVKKRLPMPPLSDEALPNVTLVIAAYNEEDFIAAKIRNSLTLDYPLEKLSIFIVTDGSTDRTPHIVAQTPQVIHFHEPIRRGKIHAVNRVMKSVTTPITIFCDANTELNVASIRLLVQHYQDKTVGGVAGEKRIVKKDQDNASSSGEGLYWKYESFLKKRDAEVSTVVGAAGELFSIRTDLYEAPDENMIIEDFYMSLRIVARGFRFAYAPDAYAMETASASVDEEWKRKVRICAGAFQAMPKLSYLMNPFRYGVVSFQYFSHRVLRWTLAPLALAVVLISNIVLALAGSSFFQIFLVLQGGFYLLAGLGHLFRARDLKIKGFFVPYYFAVMNAAVYAGFIRHMRKRQSVLWERAKRRDPGHKDLAGG